MRVLGVDPGLTRCGLGVVQGRTGRDLLMVAVGVARTPTDADQAVRLARLHEEIEAWMDEHKPDAVAVERVFARAAVSTVMATAQASAVPMILAAQRGIPVVTHTPSEVKAAVTGNGRADKDQVTAMVTRILRLDAPPRPADAADALALAICHVWRGSSSQTRGQVPNRLQEAARQAKGTRNRLQEAELAARRTRQPNRLARAARSEASRRVP